MNSTEVLAATRSALEQRPGQSSMEQVLTLEWIIKADEMNPGFLSELTTLGKESGFRLKIRVLRDGWRYLILKRLPT